MSGPIVWDMPPTAPTPAEETAAAEGATDHVAVAVNRLIRRFRRDDSIAQLLRVIVSETQPLENTLFLMLGLLSIDDQEGRQLDNIGAVVGRERAGVSDDLYRRYLRAQILVNRSRGVPEDLLAIARAVLPANAFRYTPEPPAAYTLEALGAAVTSDVAAVLAELLDEATAAGVRTVTATSTADDAHTFTCAMGGGLSVPHVIGDAALNLGEDPIALGFPQAGGVVTIDPGGTGEASLTYLYVSGAKLLVLSTPLVANYAVGTEVLAPTSAQKGLGFCTYDVTLDGDQAGGVGFVVVIEGYALAFPASGSITIAPGEVDEETVAYTSRTHDTFTLSGTTASSHFDGAVVILAADTNGGHLADGITED